jgi:hypothetical protein
MKVMYLAKRNSTFASPEAFRPRWRQHGALAMSLPSWEGTKRYVHADVQSSSPAGRAHAFDGVGVVWLSGLNAGADQAQDSTEDGAILLKDELVAFDGPVLPRAFIVEEKTLKAGNAADFVAYLFFDTAADAERAAATFAGMANAPERVVFDKVADYAPSPNPIYSYKGIVEVGARQRKDLDAALVAAQKAGVKPALEVVTRECLLWDNGPVQQAAKTA